MRPRFIVASSTALAAIALGLYGCADHERGTLTAPATPRYEQVQATPMVNSLNDPGDGTCDDTECTLREAIAFASSGALITIPSTVTGSISLSADSGQLKIDKNVSITGSGRTHIAVRGVNGRALRVGPGATVNITGVSFTDATSAFDGGVVFNAGTLTLTDCDVSGGSAGTRNGGGIANGGFDNGNSYTGATLTLIRTHVVSNTSAQMGGGIFTYQSKLTLDRSTVFSNHSEDGGGGGISAEQQDADTNAVYTTIVNSTIAGNTATGGAGIYNQSGVMRISFSTIANNTATATSDGGGGILSFNNAGTKTELRGTIIYGNRKGTTPNDVAALMTANPFLSFGGNLVGAGGLNVVIASDFANTDDQVAVNPQLDSMNFEHLDSMLVYPLAATSPAVDATSFCSDVLGTPVATDERGTTRPQNTKCDIGAFERVYVPPFSSVCTYATGSNGRNTVTVGWSLADPGVTLVTLTIDGRTAKKAMSPTAADTISLKTASGTPTYDIYGGAKRGAMTNHLVSSGTCTATGP